MSLVQYAPHVDVLMLDVRRYHAVIVPTTERIFQLREYLLQHNAHFVISAYYCNIRLHWLAYHRWPRLHSSMSLLPWLLRSHGPDICRCPSAPCMSARWWSPSSATRAYFIEV